MNISIKEAVFDYGCVFEVCATKIVGAQTFEAGTSVSLAGYHEDGSFYSLTPEQAHHAKANARAFAKQDVQRQITAHLAVINPVDND